MADRADVVQVANELAQMLRDGVDRQESEGRLPADVAAVIAESGLFRMLVPAAIGGAEAAPVEFARAVEACARANSSAGWCVMIAASTALTAGWLAPDRAAEVFGDPAGIWAGGFAPTGRAVPVEGGSRLTGRWAWGSGCQNATWFAAGARGPEGQSLHFVPASEVTIHPNWDVMGLRGTGSHDWSVTDAFVPTGLAVDPFDGRPVSDSALYRVPLFGMLASGIAAVALGTAQAALDAFVELAGGKVPTFQARALAQRPAVQVEVGSAATRLGAARSYLHDRLAAALRAAELGDPPTVAQRVGLRGAATHATEVSADVVTRCFTLAGGTSVRNDHPLALLFRDVHAMTQHVMVGGALHEAVGRTVLGVPIDRPDL